MKGSSPRRSRLAPALAAALFSVAPARAADVDLTPTLAAIPAVAEGAARLCKRACLGNQRRSWLDSAVLHADSLGSSITVVLKLRSRHEAPRGFLLYDETAAVRIDADVSLAGCGLSNVHATSNNDLYRAFLRAFATQIKAAILRHGHYC